jgi:hypothetical protein
MPVVRYVALAALVVWLGGMMGTLARDVAHDLACVGLACGAVIFVGLFVMKFVGPPPRAFVVRSAIVAAMLAITAAGRFWSRPQIATSMTLALGLLLLAWYAKE